MKMSSDLLFLKKQISKNSYREAERFICMESLTENAIKYLHFKGVKSKLLY